MTADLGAARFVSLTTFRRTGAGVATPVWIAAHGPDLVVTTPADSGKLKRLRNNPRMLLSPCGRFGAVRPGAPVVHGIAEILGPDGLHPLETEALQRKYGIEYRIVVAMEAMARRRHGKSTDRIILRIHINEFFAG